MSNQMLLIEYSYWEYQIATVFSTKDTIENYYIAKNGEKKKSANNYQ